MLVNIGILTKLVGYLHQSFEQIVFLGRGEKTQSFFRKKGKREISYIRNKKYCAAADAAPLLLCMSRSGYPLWIKKKYGLETSF